MEGLDKLLLQLEKCKLNCEEHEKQQDKFDNMVLELSNLKHDITSNETRISELEKDIKTTIVQVWGGTIFTLLTCLAVLFMGSVSIYKDIIENNKVMSEMKAEIKKDSTEFDKRIIKLELKQIKK